MNQPTTIDVDFDQTTPSETTPKKRKAAASSSETTLKKRKAAASSSEAALFPGLYVLLVQSTDEWIWQSLDLERGIPAPVVWDSDFNVEAVALSLKSEIYLLGGFQFPSKDADAWKIGPETLPPSNYSDHVHRIDPAKAPSNSKFTFLTSIPTTPYTRCNCAALSDKIYVFHFLITNLYDLPFDGYDDPTLLEVYDPSSDKWHGYNEAGLNLPTQLKGIDPDFPVLSDSLNNRILACYYSQGVYAFYPDTLKWELLSSDRFFFTYSAVINGVLYSSCRCGDIRSAVTAFDLENDLQPLRMVWPRQNKKKAYEFDREVQWMSPIDLGNGMLCLLYQVTKPVNPAHSDSDYDSDSDSEHFYCSSEDDVAPPDETNDGESNEMLVLKGMILEVEKKAGSKGNMKLWVTKAKRVRYEFNYFPSGGFRVHNIVAVARP